MANRLIHQLVHGPPSVPRVTICDLRLTIHDSSFHMRNTTHFGFQQVPEDEKERRVAGVFDSVSSRYDLMNDLMSAGMHRLWKRFTVEQSAVRPGDRVLDVAGGTGDLTRLFARRVGDTGSVVLTDINAAMITVGRDRLADEGLVVPLALCNGERLPFPRETF